MSSRRYALSTITRTDTAHSGLWLDRYLREIPERGGNIDSKEGSPITNHLKDIVSISPPAPYDKFYARWKAALEGSGATCGEATVRGRLAIGMGDESVLETSITLHHTYGVPYIPGSALKGLAASYVRLHLDNQWGKWKGKEGHGEGSKGEWIPADAYTTLFGTTDDAGFVTFYDALYVPGSGHKNQALHLDVLTVHHKDYYSGKKLETKNGSDIAPPADWDSPNPVSFLSATGKYLIALDGPAEWVAAAYEILCLALDEVGVGAKTSSGYGRMDLIKEQQQTPTAQTSIAPEKLPVTTQPAFEDVKVKPPRSPIDNLIDRIGKIKPDNNPLNTINKFVIEWRKITDPERKKQVAQAILDKARELLDEQVLSQKNWYKELVECVGGGG